MMVSKVSDIITLVMRRDRISYKDARRAVLICQDEMFEAVEAGANYEEIENILMDELGLEPDYMDILLPIF